MHQSFRDFCTAFPPVVGNRPSEDDATNVKETTGLETNNRDGGISGGG